MLNTRRAWSSRDEGFTVAEIVIAMAILFFALTALIGLMGTTTNMTASAKSKTVLTNVIASELDWIRTLPYESVALDSSPPGMIPATKTFSKHGFSIALTYTVKVRASTREVTVAGVASRPGFPDTRASSFAAVRNLKIVGSTGEDDEDQGQLVVEFTSNTPPDGAVLKGVNVHNGGVISIEARATASDAKIKTIDLSVDAIGGSAPLKSGNSIYSPKANFVASTPVDDQLYAFGWDTRQVDDAGTAEVNDGRRTVLVVAVDDKERSAQRSRTFIVDNHPPSLPSDVTGAILGQADMTQLLTASWGAATDGDNLMAPRHELDVFQNTNKNASLGSWTQLGGTYSQPTTITASSLAAYGFRVRGVSHGDRTGSYATSALLLSRPVVSGTYSATYSSSTKMWTYVHTPLFPKSTSYWSAATFALETNVGGVITTTDITAAVNTAWGANSPYAPTLSWTGPRRTGSQLTYPPTYRIKVTLTPAGWGGGASTVLYSNTVKGADLSGNGTAPTNQPLIRSW